MWRLLFFHLLVCFRNALGSGKLSSQIQNLLICILKALQQHIDDHIFTTPDRYVDVMIGNDQYAFLDANKIRQNDDILSNNKSHGALKWVSIGIPRLLWSWRDTDSVFRTDEFLAFSIVMLTDFDRLSLKEEMKRATGVDESKQAFNKLRLNDLSCEINLHGRPG